MTARHASASIGRRAVLEGLAASLALAQAGCTRRKRPEVRDGRLVVTFWYAYGDLVRKVLLDLVARYNASQSRVLVEAVHQGDYYECLAKLRTALAAGAAPTLSHVVCEVLPYLAQAGVLAPLQDMEGLPRAFVPALAQGGAFEGAAGGAPRPVYGIPFNRSTPIAFCNGAVFDEAHLAPPRTWDELLATAHALTRSVGGETRWGYEVPISWWYWVAMLGQAGGRLVEPDGRIVLGGEAGEKAVRFWQRLVAEQVMRPPPGRDYQAWQSTNESFLQGRIAMMWSSTAFVRYLETNARFPVVAAPLPRDVRASVPTGGTMFVLLASAPPEETRAGWDFVRWMCEDEQTIAWSTRTGYMPVTTTAVEALEQRGWYRSHPNDRVAYDQLPAVDPWPWLPQLFRVERDLVEPRLEEAVLTRADVHTLLDAARADAARPA